MIDTIEQTLVLIGAIAALFVVLAALEATSEVLRLKWRRYLVAKKQSPLTRSALRRTRTHPRSLD